MRKGWAIEDHLFPDRYDFMGRRQYGILHMSRADPGAFLSLLMLVWCRPLRRPISLNEKPAIAI